FRARNQAALCAWSDQRGAGKKWAEALRYGRTAPRRRAIRAILAARGCGVLCRLPNGDLSALQRCCRPAGRWFSLCPPLVSSARGNRRLARSLQGIGCPRIATAPLRAECLM